MLSPVHRIRPSCQGNSRIRCPKGCIRPTTPCAALFDGPVHLWTGLFSVITSFLPMVEEANTAGRVVCDPRLAVCCRAWYSS